MKLMAIINVTPDSFYDGGNFNNTDEVLTYIDSIKDNVDILDIGGESTRPNAIPVDYKTEINRLYPVVESVRKQFPSIPISIDTYKPDIVETLAPLGISIVNNVYSTTTDMAQVVAKHNLQYCVTSNGSHCKTIDDVINDLHLSIQLSLECGVKNKNLIIDPGIGFHSNIDLDLSIIRNLSKLKMLGYPLLIGHSNKSFIYKTLNVSSSQCISATLGITAICAWSGVDIIRVHNVPQNHQVLDIVNSISTLC